MKEDWATGDEWQEFVQHFRRNALHEIDSSAFVASVIPGEFDVKFAVELGAAIMLDKPLLVIAQPGTTIPDHLRRVADRIVEVDIDTTEGRNAVALAVVGMTKKILGD